MKRLTYALLILLGSSIAKAEWDTDNNDRPYKDVWGNSYKYKDNLDKDTDGDGVSNRFDYNDRNKNVQRKGQYDFTKPRKAKIGW